MTRLKTTAVWAAWACSATALAQGQTRPEPAVPSPPVLTVKSMTRAEQIKQLKPATNAVELMQLLRTIHEQVLLIDRTFFDDENIHRLFGEGEIESKELSPGLCLKTLTPSERNWIRFPIAVIGAKTGLKSGDIKVRVSGSIISFTPELIEAHLMPGVKGKDPFGPLEPMTNEARNIAGGRPLATHPKGYWEYRKTIRTPDHIAHISAALDRHAMAININLTQSEWEVK